ncbi:4'-phosphopantetheinyl transferase family protein [Streptomyces roseolilacinus]|uniref:4'-phosphopantetheinyl transferase family protein n=1 Tax=Streptomyces roseolilacinus TaxID=66904 RepID=UPI0037F874BC
MTDSSGRLAATGAVHLWHGHATDGIDPDPLAVLDDEELRLVHGRHAAGSPYATAHAAVRRVLADHYLGGPPGAIRFGRYPCPRCGDPAHGRPRVVSPTTRLEFSLSRSGAHWAPAVTAGGGRVGIDIEHRGAPDAERLPGPVPSGAAHARPRAPRHDDGRWTSSRARTREKAVLKAVGVGVPTDLCAPEARPGGEGPPHAGHVEPGHRSHWVVEEPDLAPDLAVALAREAGRTGPVLVRTPGPPGHRTRATAARTAAVAGEAGHGGAR